MEPNTFYCSRTFETNPEREDLICFKEYNWSLDFIAKVGAREILKYVGALEHFTLHLWDDNLKYLGKFDINVEYISRYSAKRIMEE